MKAIELKGKMILKEIGRNVNRNHDVINIEYEIVPKYGQQIDKSLDDMRYLNSFQISKESYVTGWDITKNTTRDELTEMLFTDLKDCYETYVKMLVWELKSSEEKGYRVTTRKTISGEEYSVHELKPNPHKLSFIRKQGKSAFAGYIPDLCRHIHARMNMKNPSDMKLIDL